MEALYISNAKCVNLIKYVINKELQVSELRIDEAHIAELTKDFLSLIADFMDDIKTLDNKDEDVFKRYMAMMRIGAIYSSAKQAIHVARHVFRLGLDVRHPFFQTVAAKANGWDKPTIEDNPFFIQEEKEPIGLSVSMDELPDELKESLVDALKEVLAQRKASAH